MLRFLLVPFMLGLAFPAAASGQTACTDPTPGDSAWWRWRQLPANEAHADGRVELQAPEAPSLPDSISLGTLRGTYFLQLTPAVGAERDQIVTGTIAFTSDSTGTARASTTWPSYLDVAPNSKAPHRVQPWDVLFDSTARRLTFVMGNRGLRTTDSGVFFEVFKLNAKHIIGRWVDGGLRVYGGASEGGGVRPQGWFCLTPRRQ